MKRPAIFFDRDNTLIASDGYLGDPSKVVLIDGAAEAVARARKLGFAIVVFSNQSGVARGMFSEADVRGVNDRVDAMLKHANADAIIEHHEFCPYHPQAAVEAYRRESDRRKPNPGMIHAAVAALELDVAKSWVIGDAPRDIEAGRAAGCRTILFRDPSLPESPAAKERLKTPPDTTVPTLGAAIDYIEAANAPPTAMTSGTPGVAPPNAGREVNRSAAIGMSGDVAKLTSVADEILQHLRRRTEHEPADFSVTKLLSGIVQVLSIAVMFLAYLNRTDASFQPTLIVGVWLQCLTISLLVMGRK